jgi:dTDP-4-dehydrorhamnose 3,5-epimerase-like enzyme
MAYLKDLKTFTDKRGNLTVIEKILPFKVERIFYIYGVDRSVRGGHRHHKTIQAAICIKGRCKIYNNDSITEEIFLLNKPSQCLILEQMDWHKMYDFSKNAILMVLASEPFDEKDYIFEEYDNRIRKS